MQAGESRLLSVDEACTGSVINALDNPQEIGSFSVDASKCMQYDQSQMKYYIPRRGGNLCLDLNVGSEIDEWKPFDIDERMNNLLKWLINSGLNPLYESSTNFVCIRGVIGTLLCTPFCPGPLDHWIICACRVDDVIYLKVVDTDDKIRREEEATEEQMRMCAWGHKFEQYMTSRRPRGTPNVSSTTHQTEEFCIIVTNKIGRHNLLIEAEIDGVNPNSPARPGSGDTSCYVEMKTSKLVPHFRSSYPFKKYKSLKWWAQSVTIGIEDIVCGLRDDNGIVKCIQTLKTSNLPNMCENMWIPDVSFKFCENVLTYLSRKLDRNDSRIVYKCEYYGGSSVSVSRLRNSTDRFQVLPDWYVAKLQGH